MLGDSSWCASWDVLTPDDRSEFDALRTELEIPAICDTDDMANATRSSHMIVRSHRFLQPRNSNTHGMWELVHTHSQGKLEVNARTLMKVLPQQQIIGERPVPRNGIQTDLDDQLDIFTKSAQTFHRSLR
jgi:hypothetical protein